MKINICRRKKIRISQQYQGCN